ncbi:histone-lysine N-methyltransferase ASHR2-like isoform X1 [Lycium ferocissimum]|uniref:histone-lysine N-methyltransferase ASHR2-like isoform X1 n=1 Tax=Lycium ferocissimum TaxID=112874 RepID=UPI0028151029|nr:histone-lysine N-methyltransferase ASHR2-like isoform X1 [Lycium ferocissimum]XP_059277561.1 histone-lysine N-methyltransferase ASHR2-like isoform X1 [Lycium ferocissimum]
MYPDLTPTLSVDQQIQFFFLISAYNLSVINPSSFRVLLSLQGDPSFMSENDVVLLHSVVSTICPSTNLGEFGFSKELTAALLAKDKVNAFGLMEPYDKDRERGVRAYGIYPVASFFNHDCLPNACRFEYVDIDVSNGSNNTDMIVRVIHDVPEGREICLSYFPVNFKYSERQQRLKEDYGFTCNCDRCVVEANWSDQEDDDAMDNEGEEIEEDEDEAMEEDVDVDDEVIGNGEVEERDQDFPHAYFFIRYMCNQENCGGTLAPLPPSDASTSTVMECNVCGHLSKSDEL